MEKSFSKIIRRFDPHHNALADNLDAFDFVNAKCEAGDKFSPFQSLHHWILEDLSLGVGLWRKVSVE